MLALKGTSQTDDDILVIEPTALGLTPVQASEAVKAIRDFIITLDDSGEQEREFLSSLSAMEADTCSLIKVLFKFGLPHLFYLQSWKRIVKKEKQWTRKQ